MGEAEASGTPAKPEEEAQPTPTDEGTPSAEAEGGDEPSVAEQLEQANARIKAIEAGEDDAVNKIVDQRIDQAIRETFPRLDEAPPEGDLPFDGERRPPAREAEGDEELSVEERLDRLERGSVHDREERQVQAEMSRIEETMKGLKEKYPLMREREVYIAAAEISQRGGVPNLDRLARASHAEITEIATTHAKGEADSVADNEPPPTLKGSQGAPTGAETPKTFKGAKAVLVEKLRSQGFGG